MRHILKAPKKGYEALDVQEALDYKQGKINSLQLHFLPREPWPGGGDHITIFFKHGKKRRAINGRLSVEEIRIDEGGGWVECYYKYYLTRQK